MPGHEIDKVHDKFVRKVLREIPNLVTFLKTALPEVVRQRLNLDEIELDPNSYISSQYEETRSDIVAKCRTRDEGFPSDIYILFEHKSYEDRGVLLQLLNYMNRMWEKDLEEKKPLRATGLLSR